MVAVVHLLCWWRRCLQDRQEVPPVPLVVMSARFNAVGPRFLADSLHCRQTFMTTLSLHPYDLTFR